MGWDDPVIRRGVVLGLTVVLPFAVVLSSMFLGKLFRNLERKPTAGLVVATVLVGLLAAAVTITAATIWYYVHFTYGWLPRQWGWIALVVWISSTLGAFDGPRIKASAKRRRERGITIE